MTLYIWRNGKAVHIPDASEWAVLWNREDRMIGKTTVGQALVSTVFLGIDHSHWGGPPVLWETMVFGGSLDGEQVQYTSRADAEAGHAAMVERVRAEGGE